MFSGSITALVTPFNGDAVDERQFQDLVQRQIAAGTNGLVPVGTTGESPTLSHDEHKRVVEACISAASGSGVPVIAGTGSNSTAEAIALTQHAADAGANGALVVTPYYNKPTQEGLKLHYRAIADAVDLPIIIYNIPGRSIIDMSVATMAELAQHPNIVGVKDATADLARPLETSVAIDSDFCQLSGEDATALAFLAQGGAGCISVTSNVVPDLCAALHKAWQNRDLDQAKALNEKLMPLHNALFCETSPGPVKYALELMGLCPAITRLPLAPISDASKSKVRAALDGLGLIG